ncbi:uncharacterized protein [Eleutherodactylus coqui]|uniref:uncharacterized protein n=1 Tax=Eleutherodactylus coqui TaxID=57060 RepID=UPI0034633811
MSFMKDSDAGCDVDDMDDTNSLRDGTKCRFITRKSNLLTPTEPYITPHIPASAEDHSRYITQDEGETPELTMRPVSVLLLLSLSAAFILISVHSNPRPEPQCLENQHRGVPGTQCLRNCDNLGALITCEIDKVERCLCNDGFVFQSGSFGPCVLPKDCPAPCPKNMTRENVCRPCPRSCGEELDEGCVICLPPTECYCERHYVHVFDDTLRFCVIPKDCP